MVGLPEGVRLAAELKLKKEVDSWSLGLLLSESGDLSCGTRIMISLDGRLQQGTNKRSNKMGGKREQTQQ